MPPSPTSVTVKGALRRYTKLTLFVMDRLLLESTEYADTVLVPGMRVTWADQFVQKPLLGEACVQAELLREYNTLVTRALSVVLPVIVKAELLHCSFAVGAVMLIVGRLVSAKLAVNTRFEAMVKVRVGLLVVRLPLQLVNLKPLVPVAVMEKFFPICSRSLL